MPHKIDTAKLKPITIDKEDNCISKDQLNKNVISILEKLKKAGYSAYIVGGGVRDLILGYKPKDFDIATNAKPDEIRALFKNSRIIGRRFRLVHVYFHREIIEVATFRAAPSEDDADLATNGRIIRDNIYGNLDDDIWRRDFTVNALYYDAIDEIIIDYCGGFKDLKNHVLKIIGDPKVRYREDPVRMLRALRFAAKLDFTIEDQTLNPIKNQEYHNLLDDIPSARLFEEYNKLFLIGHGEKSFYILNKYKLFNKLFPYTATETVEAKYPQHISFIHSVLKSTDNRIANNLPINPAFLIAAFLWHPLSLEHQDIVKSKNSKEYTWRDAAHSIIKKQNISLAIPKRFTRVMEDIWFLQRLFNKKHKKAIDKIAAHPKFRAGFDFLILRADIEPIDETIVKWWQTYEASDEPSRQKILESYEL